MRLRRYAWLLLIFLLPACSIVGGTDTLGALPHNRELWQEQGADDYQFDLAKACFCPAGLYPATVVVRADTVSAVLDPETGDPLRLPDSDQFTLDQHPDAYLTIDELFDVIEEALNEGADRLNVDYDNERGFPRVVVIDYSASTADDEVRYEVSNLTLN